MKTNSDTNIAYLEDDPVQNRRVSCWLSQHGYQCYSHKSAEEIVAAFSAKQFDIALLDWQLDTGSSGLEVLKHLRLNHRSTIPIIVLSSKNSPEDMELILNAGADDFILKPACKRELLSLLDSYSRQPTESKDSIIQYRPYSDNTKAKRIYLDEVAIDLSEHEYTLLSYLFEHNGQAVSFDDLIGRVCENPLPLDRRQLISDLNKLKKRIFLGKTDQWLYETILNYGCRLTQINPMTVVA